MDNKNSKKEIKREIKNDKDKDYDYSSIKWLTGC